MQLRLPLLDLHVAPITSTPYRGRWHHAAMLLLLLLLSHSQEGHWRPFVSTQPAHQRRFNKCFCCMHMWELWLTHTPSIQVLAAPLQVQAPPQKKVTWSPLVGLSMA